MSKKTRLLVLAGGQSEEHEVSITSARSLLAATAGSHLDATVRVIARDGRWLSAEQSVEALTNGSARTGSSPILHGAQATEDFDVVFPLLHGPFGEDGTMQGLLELADRPYVGSGVLASALCMDKPLGKDVLRTHGVEQVGYEVILRADFSADPNAALQRATALGPPWFVKPANLGSSVGISKAPDVQGLRAAVATAFRFDRRVIVEEAVPNARELEVAILGNEHPEASPVGEIKYDAEFYDYETKYTEGRAELCIPADIPAQVSDRIRSLACRTFTLLDCAGFARVDFFYQPADGRILLNEVNTIPGFTPFSMFPRLWQAAGLSYAELVERLVELAQQRHRERVVS